jgi:hypothetical protein
MPKFTTTVAINNERTVRITSCASFTLESVYPTDAVVDDEVDV